MAKAPHKERLTIDGPAGRLEALLETPEGAAGERVAVLCHPHPLHQGTMLNKVVHTLARAMNDLGLPALRFNFRGVGASQGSYAQGEGELGDVVAVAEYARDRWPDCRIWLAGFSFGAVVAARAAERIQPEQLVSIAPAVSVLEPGSGEVAGMPWLVVQGGEDEIVSPAEVKDWVASLQPGPELVVLPEAGHFFHGHLVDLRSALVNQLSGAVE